MKSNKEIKEWCHDRCHYYYDDMLGEGRVKKALRKRRKKPVHPNPQPEVENLAKPKYSLLPISEENYDKEEFQCLY